MVYTCSSPEAAAILASQLAATDGGVPVLCFARDARALGASAGCLNGCLLPQVVQVTSAVFPSATAVIVWARLALHVGQYDARVAPGVYKSGISSPHLCSWPP